MGVAGVVYGLYDPRTRELRYVGKTEKTLKQRLRGHFKKARAGSERHCSCWVRGLLAQDLQPFIKVIEADVPVDRLNAREEHWIAYFRAHGARLTNLTEGGDGVDSASARARCAAMTLKERRAMIAPAQAACTPATFAKRVATKRLNDPDYFNRLGREGCAALHAEKLDDGRSKHAVKIAEIVHAKKDSRGKSAVAVKAGTRGGPKAAAVVNAQRWQCGGCDMVTNSGALRGHQKATGHTGRTRLR